MAHWDSAQGQAKMAKKTPKLPYLWRSIQKSSNPRRKIVFSILTPRLSLIRGGFEQLSSSSGWRFMAKKWRANILACAVVKGTPCKTFIKNKLCKVSRWRARDRDRNPSRPRRDLKHSRPRPWLRKMGLETRLETETKTKSRDSITG